MVRYLCERDAQAEAEADTDTGGVASHEHARATLAAVGYQVGQQLGEVHSREKARFVEQLDCIKFVCKDLWYKLFKKPVDNLKTNHRGVFVLLDNNFRWTSRLTATSSSTTTTGNGETTSSSMSSIPPPLFAALACGILQGSLHALGVHCIVSADMQRLPACTFTLTISSDGG